MLAQSALQARWERLTQSIAAPATSRTVFDELIAAYTGADRHYHNLGHITGCLSELDGARNLAADPAAMELAIWFHDVVYDTHRPDNEERSAEFARSALQRLGVGHSLVGAVSGLILDTKHKVPPASADGRLMVDIDLAGLAAPPDVFDDNTRRIRKEFAHVSDADFAAGRGKFLVDFLARQRIYYTDWYFDGCESPARENLRRAVARMKLQPR